MAKLKEVSAAAEESLGIKANQLFGDWVVVKKLDEGGFGKVFKVENVKTPGRVAALKAESSKNIGGAAIKLEIIVLEMLNKNSSKMHIPQLFRARRRKKFHYMIVTLLGENLRSLRVDSKSGKISAKTWSRLAIQCLYGIKFVHEVGYIHRDIKPANFVMGYRSDVNRARVVHILDFGMARSLMYMLIELHCGLPWHNESDKKRMAFMKQQIPDELLMKDFPIEMHHIIPALRKLNYYNRPDYLMFYEACLKLMKNLAVKFDEPYDWETEKDLEYIIRRRTRKPDYEDAVKFFSSDILDIDKPPGDDATQTLTRTRRAPFRTISHSFGCSSGAP